MKKIALFMIIIVAFSTGYFLNSFSPSKPIKTLTQSIDSFISGEKNSPYDWIKENQILVYDDKVIINQEGVSWASYLDTNSMDPILDETSNGLEIIPKIESDIHIGDIVTYQPLNSKDLVVHRVNNISKDNEGIYYSLKGDNNPISDPEKIRFNQIKYILIGVIY